jgi:hypothetical protein
MTRLFGQSPAGLTATGESDIRNYYDRISADQESRIRPGMERLLEAVIRSTLGHMPKDVAITFKPLWQMSDKERSEIEYANAQRDQIYLLQGVIPEHTVTARLVETGVYGNSLTQDDVDLVKKLAAQAAVLPDPGKLGAVQPGGKKAPKAGQEPAGNAEPGTGKDTAALDIIRKKPDGWHLYSANGKKHLGGPYSKEELAVRIAQVEGHKKDDQD